MKKNLLLIFIILIIMPITVIAVLGVNALKSSEKQKWEEQKDEAEKILVIQERLLQDSIRQIELELETISLDPEINIEELRWEMNRQRMVKQAFMIDETGSFTFPDPGKPMSQREKEFLSEAENIDLPGSLGARISPDEQGGLKSQWYTWFMGDGINFIYYKPIGSEIHGFLIERYALISKLIAVLPENNENDKSYRIQLTDARGNTLYQWGGFSVTETSEPLREFSLSEPLGSWRLFYYFNENEASETFRGLKSYFLISILSIMTLIIFFLAFYFFRENSREMDIARKKVSFVNQVSHELKTPLTNIRLYSELLQNQVTTDKDRSYIDVIVNESERLGRMINNVLTFSKGEKGELRKQIDSIDMNVLIDELIEKFNPLMIQNSVEINYEKRTLPRLENDRDMIEQILVNLLGNALKYGAGGQYVEIKTITDNSFLKVSIEDRGPGIRESERDKIFQPFYRIDNSLTQNTSGTGIGLSIAATLAKETGSVLKYEQIPAGACFSLKIPLKGIE